MVSAERRGRGVPVLRVLLVLAAADALAGGLWALTRPRDLFDVLGMTPRGDAWAWELFQPSDDASHPVPPPRDAGLWHLLGLLSLAQASFLIAAVPTPRARAGLVVAPLLARVSGLGVWLWALGTTYTFPPRRLPFPERTPLVVLAAREAILLLALTAFFVVARQTRVTEPEETLP